MDFDYLDQEDFKNNYAQSGDCEAMDFYLENVHCAKCLSKVEGAKQSIPGIRNIELNLGNSVARVEKLDEGKFSDVAKKWYELGFIPHPIHSRLDVSVQRKKENRARLNRLGVAGVVAGNIMLFSFAIYSGATGEWARRFDLFSGILFIAVLLYSSTPFYTAALSAIKNKAASIDLPIVLSILIGAGISYLNLFRGQGHVYFDSLSMLVFLILASRYVLSLFQQNLLAPSYFKEFFKLERVEKILPDSSRVWILAESIKVGDKLEFNEGDTFAVDGELLSQDTWIDTSVVNGEFFPEYKKKGDTIYAGSKALEKKVHIKALTSTRNSYLGKLIDQVEDQLLKKTPLISLTDKIAQYFTLSILTVGTLFFLFYFQIDLGEAINRSLALVILACPCALAFATPLSQSLSLSKLAKAGILVKKAEVLEKVNQSRHIFFDKTGTLSKGELKFQGWGDKEPTEEQKSLIFSLEKESKHPVAKAFRFLLKDYLDKTLPLSDWEESVGVGVQAKYEGNEYSLRAVAKETDVRCVGLFKNGECVLEAYFGDIEKEDSRDTLSAVSDMGFSTYILSGDKTASVENFTKHIGVKKENIHSQMKPEDKEAFIKKYPDGIMVGDGANDLLALTGSHVSVAVKGSMEASLRVADVYIAKEGVSGVNELIHVSKESMKVIKRNLIISAVYNSLGAVAALLGYVNPLVAAILMPFSSFVVVLSAVYGTPWLRSFVKKIN